jgi:hypothetical protein
MTLPCIARCRDSILYRLVEAYFTAHDHWASQCNITIMYPGHFPALTLSLHSCASSRSIMHIFAFHHTSSRSIMHLRVSSCIFAFHRNLVRIITGASIHCPASSLVRHIPFITISDYVWHCTISILLWTLTLHHLHT